MNVSMISSVSIVTSPVTTQQRMSDLRSWGAMCKKEAKTSPPRVLLCYLLAKHLGVDRVSQGRSNTVSLCVPTSELIHGLLLLSLVHGVWFGEKSLGLGGRSRKSYNCIGKQF